MSKKRETNKKVQRTRSKRREDSAAAAASLSAAIIQYLLLSLKITQTDIGKVLGLSRSSICLIKKGKRSLRITDIIILAKSLGKPIYELIEAVEYEPEGLETEYEAFKKALKSSPVSNKIRSRV